MLGLAVASGGSIGAAAQPTERSLAILAVPEEGGSPNPIETLAVRHMAEVAGVPFIVTAEMSEALAHKVVITTEEISQGGYTGPEMQALETYVRNGGVLIVPNVSDESMYYLFGIQNDEFSRQRYHLTFAEAVDSKAFTWIDQERERTLQLGDPDQDQIIFTRGYTPGAADVLARFGDGSAAITRHRYGEGYAYAIGLAFRDVIIRNQLGLDFSANRSYSNDFEPTSDVFYLLLRGLVKEHLAHAVWKHTAPFNSRSVLIITHDVDSESSMEWMDDFAVYEQARGISATYFITTHYINDCLDGDYYTPYRDKIRNLYMRGHRIASHSVGHFPDFDELPLGEQGNTRATYSPGSDCDQTTGGTIMGEVEVSRNLLEQDTPQPITAFRAGYLAYPDKLINALDALDYRFNSTFSANNVMNSFPYRALKGRSFSGPITSVWEIPVTISDVFDVSISSENYREKVAIWLEALRKYQANGSPTVLLIHPNRAFKLEALKHFLKRMPEGVVTRSINAYGEFWLRRQALTFATEWSGNELVIQLEDQDRLPNGVSLVIEGGSQVPQITLQNAEGENLQYKMDTIDGDLFVIYDGRATSRHPAEVLPEHARLHLPYPNPFSEAARISYELAGASRVKLVVYDVLGREVARLVDGFRSAGTHSTRFDAGGLSSGIYFLMLRAGSSSYARRISLIQ